MSDQYEYTRDEIKDMLRCPEANYAGLVHALTRFIELDARAYVMRQVNRREGDATGAQMTTWNNECIVRRCQEAQIWMRDANAEVVTK